ncbi:MAG: DnaB-like helicase C-terminal domain-containing protein [Syntrophales bacterium]
MTKRKSTGGKTCGPRFPSSDKTEGAESKIVPLARLQDMQELIRKNTERGKLFVRAVERKYLGTIPSGMITTGFPRLDDWLGGGFSGGELVAIAGPPGIGTRPLSLMITRRALDMGCPVLYLALKSTGRLIFDDLVSRASGIPLGKIRKGDLSDPEWPALIAAVSRSLEETLCIYESELGSFAELTAITSGFAAKEKRGLVVIDDFQMLCHLLKSDGRRYRTVATDLKRLAKRLDLPFLILSGLGRTLKRQTILADLDRFALSDLSDIVILMSQADKHVYHGAGRICPSDALILLRPPDEEIRVMVSLAKNGRGNTGSMQWRWDARKMVFKE